MIKILYAIVVKYTHLSRDVHWKRRRLMGFFESRDPYHFFEELEVASDSKHKFGKLTGKEGSIKWRRRLFIFNIINIVHMNSVYYFLKRLRELVLHYQHNPDHSVVVVQDLLFFQNTLVFHALEETPLDIIRAGPS